MSAPSRELADRELGRTHARYRAELARVDVRASNRDNALAYERACALLAGGLVWADLSPTQWELVVPGRWTDRRDSGVDVVTLDRDRSKATPRANGARGCERCSMRRGQSASSRKAPKTSGRAS